MNIHVYSENGELITARVMHPDTRITTIEKWLRHTCSSRAEVWLGNSVCDWDGQQLTTRGRNPRVLL